MIAEAAVRKPDGSHPSITTCPCFSCASRRRGVGLPPLPITIGRHVIPSLPVAVAGERSLPA